MVELTRVAVPALSIAPPNPPPPAPPTAELAYEGVVGAVEGRAGGVLDRAAVGIGVVAGAGHTDRLVAGERAAGDDQGCTVEVDNRAAGTVELGIERGVVLGDVVAEHAVGDRQVAAVLDRAALRRQGRR